MSTLDKHLELLGKKVRDRVTGFEGVIESVNFELYGCIQSVVKPPVDKDGKVPEGRWFDIIRLEIVSEIPVMDRPDFEAGYTAEGKQGSFEKPAR